MDYADDIGVRVVCGGDIGEDGWGFYVDIRTSAGWEDHRIDVRSYNGPGRSV